jgi:hypothetical protein
MVHKPSLRRGGQWVGRAMGKSLAGHKHAMA